MKYTILLVDDDEAIHKLIPSFLERRVKRYMFTLHSAKNGAEGVEMYDKLTRAGQKPDLVIMDLRMPVMDGAEATKRIIENDPKANIYLFTAYAGTEIESEARKAGAKGTITKGADWYWTADSITSILELKK